MSDLPVILTISAGESWPERLKRLVGDFARLDEAKNTDEAEQRLDDDWVRLLVIDGGLPNASALVVRVEERWPDVVILFMVRPGEGAPAKISHSVPNLVRPLRRGAVRSVLQKGLSAYEANRQDGVAKAQLVVNGFDDRHDPSSIDEDGIARAADSPMEDVCEKLLQVAHYDIPVLLMGESGTGKELAARALHARSLRWNKPIVVENCGALPDELLESELFGHVRGAFTGAVADREGMFARADGGTLFLDEIGEISPAFQVKLLRVLQDGEVRKLGGQESQRVNVRVIAATNRDLEEDVRVGRFREDLFYRLSTVTMALPPLRDRPMDIEVLAHRFLRRCEADFGKHLDGFAPDTMQALKGYDWPGNVRELNNEIKHMVVMARAGEPVPAEALSPKLAAAGQAHDLPNIGTAQGAALNGHANGSGSLKDRIEALEAHILTETLARHAWNKSRAARELGLSRVGLRSKLDRYGIQQASDLVEPAGSF